MNVDDICNNCKIKLWLIFFGDKGIGIVYFGGCLYS